MIDGSQKRSINRKAMAVSLPQPTRRVTANGGKNKARRHRPNKAHPLTLSWSFKAIALSSIKGSYKRTSPRTP